MKRGMQMLLAAAGTMALAAPSYAHTDAEGVTASEGQVAITDAQVEQFAAAAIEVNRINDDPTTAAEEKEQQIIEAIETQGLDVQTFNHIARTSKSDAALKQKINAAISARQQS